MHILFMLLNLQKTKYIILNYKHLLFILIHHASLCQYSVEIQSPEVSSGAAPHVLSVLRQQNNEEPEALFPRGGAEGYTVASRNRQHPEGPWGCQIFRFSFFLFNEIAPCLCNSNEFIRKLQFLELAGCLQ